MNELFNQVKIMIDNYISDGKVPAISLGIVKDNQLMQYQAGFQQIVDGKIPLVENPIFDLASLSKVTTTLMLILKLIENSDLSLDVKVKDILKDFPHKDMTIKHLLIHTSGYPADDKAYKLCKNKKEMYEFIKKLTLLQTLDTKVVYSCFNYLLLGFIIEELKGNMAEYARNVLFEPLHMNDTGYLPNTRGLTDRCVATELTDQRGLIRGEVHDGKAFIVGGIAGNAGVFSTIEDLSHLAIMLLHNGQYQQNQCYQADTIALLKQSYTDNLNERRSLGWFFADPYCQFATKETQSCLYHTGFTGTSMYIDFDRTCAIIILTNRVHPTRENANISKIRQELHSYILNGLDNV